MSLHPPVPTRTRQATWRAKAKGSPGDRVYRLYDTGSREDVRTVAYHRGQANGGAAGVDGQHVEDIAADGGERGRAERAEALRKKASCPPAVRRVYLPKPAGMKRPLGIQTIRNRVGQRAVGRVAAPIFEADLLPEPYAYSPGRHALAAVKRVHALLTTGHTAVGGADVSAYFDRIPHAESVTGRGCTGSRGGSTRRGKHATTAGDRIGRRGTRIRDAAPRKGRRSRRCAPISTGDSSGLAGNRWDRNRAFRPGS